MAASLCFYRGEHQGAPPAFRGTVRSLTSDAMTRLGVISLWSDQETQQTDTADD